MLTTLTINNVVLIDHLSLEMSEGLCALTGETGAGKSILLDALGLALGNRGESRLVRSGEEKATVTAVFETPPSLTPSLKNLFSQHELDFDPNLILRRILTQDGRSKAFINDQPISIGLLKEIGTSLVEIHGQFDTQNLLNPQTHRYVLDHFAQVDSKVETVATLWHGWQEKKQRLTRLKASIAQSLADQEFLEHAVKELDDLNPQEGEEEALAEKRTFLASAEKLIDAMNTAQKALENNKGARDNLHTALRVLERSAEQAQGKFDTTIAALNRAAAELDDGLSYLTDLSYEIMINPKEQEALNERLFALRGLARKHGVTPNELPMLLVEFKEKLTLIGDQSAELKELEISIKQARADYIDKATELSEERQKEANKLAKAVMAELAPLKLEKAKFVVSVTPQEETQWGPSGLDQIAFLVATNPGSAPGPLNKIASGGELARFMLAIKVITTGQNHIPTMIFDEVDTGIGGATADAVGERLARLGQSAQVLTVTHSPQVAARGTHQFKISKLSSGQITKTTVTLLSPNERVEEIARMLAGSSVTDEARAAAKKLLAQETMIKKAV